MNKEKLKKNKLVVKFYREIITLFYNNKFKYNKKFNTVKIEGALHNTNILIFGRNNNVIAENINYADRINIVIRGDNNKITINNNCVLRNVNIYIEDSNNNVEIGKNSVLFGPVSINCIEGTKVKIGSDCLFASDTYLRTGDSHSILNMNNNRINPSKDITIGNHCWIAQNSLILKNVSLADNIIVGAGSIVTKSFNKEHIAIAGNPAKIVKENIKWDANRI